MPLMSKHKGLVKHLQMWGLKVEQKEGWRHRGRPYDFKPKAIIAHHTASNSASGKFASDGIVTSGRPDLPGPLCQILLGRDGTVRLIAAGYSNHAGYGGPKAGMPANMGNTYSYGIEAENNGIGEPWSKAQLNAYYRLCAALLVWMGTKDVNRVIGHKEWTSRKIDPAGINMDNFRNQVRKALNHGPSVKTVKLSKLKPGKRNSDILRVKKRLAKKGFSQNDGESKFFGNAMKQDFRAFQLSRGLKGKQADGIPDKASLKKLGFRVVP